MSSPYKPENYNSVSPYLVVNGAEQTMAFLAAVFGAAEIRRFPDDQGKLMHAEVRLDDTVIMLADAVPDWPAAPAHVHVYVANVDATYERALAAGAASVQEPLARAGEEDKRGGVKDPGGTTWWIATRMG
jgi:PhnB protein